MSYVHTFGPRAVGWLFYRLAMRRFQTQPLPEPTAVRPIPTTSRGLAQAIRPGPKRPFPYHEFRFTGIMDYWVTEAYRICPERPTDRPLCARCLTPMEPGRNCQVCQPGPPPGSPGGRCF